MVQEIKYKLVQSSDEQYIEEDFVHESLHSLIEKAKCVYCKRIPLKGLINNETKEINCQECLNKKGSNITDYDATSLVFKKMLSKLMIKCKYYSNGCKLIAPLDSIKHHHNECSFSHFECSKCKETHPKPKIQEHFTTKCKTKRLVCYNCKKNIPSHVFNDHISHCHHKSNKYHCEYCNTEVFNNRKELHDKHCGYFKIRCKHCDEYFIRSEEKKHMVECREKFESVEKKYNELNKKKKESDLLFILNFMNVMIGLILFNKWLSFAIFFVVFRALQSYYFDHIEKLMIKISYKVKNITEKLNGNDKENIEQNSMLNSEKSLKIFKIFKYFFS